MQKEGRVSCLACSYSGSKGLLDTYSVERELQPGGHIERVLLLFVPDVRETRLLVETLGVES